MAGELPRHGDRRGVEGEGRESALDRRLAGTDTGEACRIIGGLAPVGQRSRGGSHSQGARGPYGSICPQSRASVLDALLGAVGPRSTRRRQRNGMCTLYAPYQTANRDGSCTWRALNH